MQSWFGQRGHPVDSTQATWIANWGADHNARTNGARGTCSETGIFYAESDGRWDAQSRLSSASGGYQYLDSTWAGYMGYQEAWRAPPWVQRHRFLETWDGGRGRSHWTESVC